MDIELEYGNRYTPGEDGQKGDWTGFVRLSDNEEVNGKLKLKTIVQRVRFGLHEQFDRIYKDAKEMTGNEYALTLIKSSLATLKITIFFTT